MFITFSGEEGGLGLRLANADEAPTGPAKPTPKGRVRLERCERHSVRRQPSTEKLLSRLTLRFRE